MQITHLVKLNDTMGIVIGQYINSNLIGCSNMSSTNRITQRDKESLCVFWLCILQNEDWGTVFVLIGGEGKCQSSGRRDSVLLLFNYIKRS